MIKPSSIKKIFDFFFAVKQYISINNNFLSSMYPRIREKNFLTKVSLFSNDI